jgi:hypothetical protein
MGMIIMGLSLLLIGKTVLAAPIATRAATESEISMTKGGAIGFSVKPLYGKNQRQENVNYWSLRVKPKEVVNLSLAIINGDADHDYDIVVNQAITNGNLTVDYSKKASLTDKMLSQKSPIDFPSVAAVADSQKNQTTISVKRHTVVTVPIAIHVPEKAFVGQAVGGVSVTRHATAAEQKSTINNVYNYTYAIVMAEGAEKIAPNISLVSLQAQAKQFNNTITVNVKNATNAIASGVSVKGVVTNAKGKQVAKLVMNHGTISPLAKFGLVFHNTEAQWAPGKYHVKLTMADKDKHQWLVDQTITIKGNKVVTEKVIMPNQNQLPRWLIGLLVVLILMLMGAGGYFYVKARRLKPRDR